MAIKVTINNSEIKNPVIRFFVTLVLLILFTILGLFILFFILPILWFFVASSVLLVMALLSATPKLRAQYKIIMLDRKKIENNQNPPL